MKTLEESILVQERGFQVMKNLYYRKILETFGQAPTSKESRNDVVLVVACRDSPLAKAFSDSEGCPHVRLVSKCSLLETMEGIEVFHHKTNLVTLEMFKKVLSDPQALPCGEILMGIMSFQEGTFPFCPACFQKRVALDRRRDFDHSVN